MHYLNKFEDIEYVQALLINFIIHQFYTTYSTLQRRALFEENIDFPLKIKRFWNYSVINLMLDAVYEAILY